MIKTVRDPNEVIDFYWKYSQLPQTNSYHIVKTKDQAMEKLEDSLSRDNHEILAYYQGEDLLGFCVYFWIEETKYCQPLGFFIKSDYDQVAGAFVERMRNKCPGYQLMISFPYSNAKAVDYFGRHGVCIESSYDMRLYDIEHKDFCDHDQIREIGLESFDVYAGFHDRFALASGMYYNSKNLRGNLKNFKVYAYYENEEIVGSIFVAYRGKLKEIFSVFIDEAYKNTRIRQDLIREAISRIGALSGRIEELVYFVEDHDHDELKDAKELGFEISEHPICFRIQF